MARVRGARTIPKSLEMHERMLTPQSDKSNALTLTSTGTGDLADLASNLQPQRASFAYAKVKYNNDEHSFREKFILVIWIGDEVKVMRRAKVRFQSPYGTG